MQSIKMMEKKGIALFFLSLSTVAGFAQSPIKGNVKDANGEPILGATVKVNGSKVAAVTDLDGNFVVNAKPGSTITVSYVGFVSQTVTVNGTNLIPIVLKEDDRMLNDVVVIGYGVQKKSDLTGAVASVNGDDIKNLATSDAGAALQGKVTGVQIINSGAPGAGAEIRVRGYGSNGNNSPLLIVDGLKVDNIQYLDPSLIKSVEVLKDAASAAIYGAEAGNGVVLITTKSGSNNGGHAQISYTLKAANQSLGKKADLFDAPEYIEYHKYLGDLTDEELKSKNYNGQNTNWYDEVFGNSWSVEHNVTVQGGNDKGHLLAGLGYVDNDGIVKGKKDVYRRFTAQLNADYKFYDWLTVTSNTSVEKWSTRALTNGYQSFLNSVVSIDPLTPAYVYSQDDMGINMKDHWNMPNHGNVMTPPGYTDENPIWYGTSKYIEDATGNPLAMRDRRNAKNSGLSVRGSLAANFTPTKWLTVTSRLGYRISNSNSHEYLGPFWLTSMAYSDNYSISAATNSGLYYQWENFANFLHSFGKHNVGAMIGMSYTKNHWDNTSASSSDTKEILEGDAAPNYQFIDFLNANGKSHLKANNQPGDATQLSYFGRLSYNYDERYFFQFNIRRDAFDSSKLSAHNRWGTFPSVSTGWAISNEKFFKNAVSPEAVSFLKLRASWGRNGNVNILSGYKYQSTIGFGGYYNFTNEATTGAAPTSLANPDLTWETAEQTDLGLDARFLNDRLTFGFDWYRKMTKDLLINIQPYPEIGFSTATVNSGKILNTGVDIDLGWKDHIGDLKYSVSTNFSTLKNEVKKVNDLLPRYSEIGINGFNNKLSPTFEAGHPMWYFRGFKYAGVDKETGKALYYDKNGEITDAPKDDDKQDLGSAIPKFTYGITINLEYKGFDFTVFGTGAAGNKIYNLMVSADRPRINGIDTYWKDSWKQKGDNAKYPDMKVVSTDWTFFSSSAAIFNGSYFKFKQIELGYTLPSKLTRKALISSLRFSVSLDDFFTITSYPGADPETSSLNSGASRGFDNGNYPTSKKVVFGVNLTF
jgi:TonB-linked SusC/RagA family outer membrane protein